MDLDSVQVMDSKALVRRRDGMKVHRGRWIVDLNQVISTLVRGLAL